MPAGATAARPVLCDAGGPGAGRQPGRGRRARARRRALAHARRRRRARRGHRARARLRAGLPSPHVDLRRGRAGDRALPGGHRRAAAARLRASARGGRRPAGRARRLARPDRRRPHQGRAAGRRRGGEGRAGRHAHRLAARHVLRARRRRRGPRRVLRGAAATTTAGSSSSRTGCWPTSTAISTARSPSRWRTASGCGSMRDGELRRHHDGPDQRRRVSAAGRRVAARGDLVRQVPRRHVRPTWRSPPRATAATSRRSRAPAPIRSASTCTTRCSGFGVDDRWVTPVRRAADAGHVLRDLPARRLPAVLLPLPEGAGPGDPPGRAGLRRDP